TLEEIRKNNYDVVINLQRFASTGILTAFSKAKIKIGFNKNPLSFLFTKKVKHQLGNGLHEIDRNQVMIEEFTDGISARPKLYPSDENYKNVQRLKNKPYIIIAPVSAWFTKTFPYYKWIELIAFYSKKFS